MKKNQAKAIAGISPRERIRGRDAYKAKAKLCTKLAAKFHNDKNPGNKAAAEKFLKLIEARDCFEKLAENHCPDCDVPISRGATHCRLHQKKRLLTDPLHTAAKRNAGNRLDVKPKGGEIARLGFYTKEIQDVIKKWRDQIPADRLENYLVKVATAIKDKTPLWLVQFADDPKHHAAVFELAAAFSKIYNNLDKPEAWLLRTNSALTDHQSDSWDAIHKDIIRQGGKITYANLTKTADRMELTTSKDDQRHFRESVPSLKNQFKWFAMSVGKSIEQAAERIREIGQRREKTEAEKRQLTHLRKLRDDLKQLIKDKKIELLTVSTKTR